MPVYDEYEEEYLGAMPKEPVIEPRSNNGEIKLQCKVRRLG